MKVIFCAEAIRYPLTGIGRYALMLANGLAEHPDIEEIRYFGMKGWVDSPDGLAAPGNVTAAACRKVPFRPLARWVYQRGRQWLFRRAMRQCGDFIYHAPNYVLAPHAGPSVCTIHDLSHLRHPECHPRERVDFLSRELPKTLARANHLIADSEFVRGEIIREFGIDPARISATLLGCDAAFRPRESAALHPAMVKYGLSGQRYLLAVATQEPRKNLERLLDAYSRLPVMVRAGFPLVLAGGKGWENKVLESRIFQMERAGEIRRLGYVPEADLPLLYAGAHAFAFPSRYEGFGLPLLEALSCGIPSLTSRSSSLIEVAGDAALLVAPDDVDAMTQQLEVLLLDDNLRSRLSADALAQAGKFSWARCVEQTVVAYQKAIKSHG